VCSTCGCVVTEKIAKERKWGTIRVPTSIATRKPQCSKECAEQLYAARYVMTYWQEGNPK